MKGFHEENEFEKYACLFKIMCPLEFGNITQISVREVNFEKNINARLFLNLIKHQTEQNKSLYENLQDYYLHIHEKMIKTSLQYIF